MKTKPNNLFKLDLQLFTEGDPAPTPESQDQKYLDVIKELKEKSVSKEEYDKVVADRDKLLNDYLNGGSPTPEVEVDTTTEKELIEALYGDKAEELSNLEYWKKTCKLREMQMGRGMIDPGVPRGRDGEGPTTEDFARSAKVFEVIQECINEAGDDPAKFNELLDGRVIGGLPKKK